MQESKREDFILTLTTWRKLRLPGSSRFQRAHAGKGDIASLLGKLLTCETWGCELFPYRAEKAAGNMDKCHSTTWESCSLTDDSVTLLWLNPPYDDDRNGSEKRLELAFRKSTTPKLVRGGLLAFVIPQRILNLVEIARCQRGLQRN